MVTVVLVYPDETGHEPATPDATEGSFWSTQTMHGTASWLWMSEEVRRFPNPGHGETCPNWSEQMLPYTFLLFLLEAVTAIHKLSSCLAQAMLHMT